tara:strand:+ start:755 stop:958 length:204 start_codon:yes stop_codon:yes gene_type:complete
LNELDLNPQLSIYNYVGINRSAGLTRAVCRESELLQQFADFSLAPLALLSLHLAHYFISANCALGIM